MSRLGARVSASVSCGLFIGNGGNRSWIGATEEESKSMRL
jgi:hypothetical protein